MVIAINDLERLRDKPVHEGRCPGCGPLRFEEAFGSRSGAAILDPDDAIDPVGVLADLHGIQGALLDHPGSKISQAVEKFALPPRPRAKDSQEHDGIPPSVSSARGVPSWTSSRKRRVIIRLRSGGRKRSGSVRQMAAGFAASDAGRGPARTRAPRNSPRRKRPT